MFQDMIHSDDQQQQQQQQQLPIDDIPSPISGPIFDFSDTDLFSEALQNSEVSSSNNCCYEENSSSYCKNLPTPPPPDIDNTYNGYQDNNNGNHTTSSTTTNASATTVTATTTNNNNSNDLSKMFDSPVDNVENDISDSIDFSDQSHSFPFLQYLTQQDQFDLSLVQSQIQLADVAVDGLQCYTTDRHHPVSAPLMGPPMPSVYDQDYLPSYVPINPSSPTCSFLGPGGLAAFMPNDATLSMNIIMGSEMQSQDLEYDQCINVGMFCPDSVRRVFNPGDLQAMSSDSQQVVGGSASSSTPLASEMSSLEDSTFNKVGKLSAEQRKEKIHRYMKKRNERNFNKKIKYACRKTLADSRARVRGRFAKNDGFGETSRQACSSNPEEDDDDQEAIIVKEEKDMVDSSDIFAHISGVNSFKCNYPIQTWI